VVFVGVTALKENKREGKKTACIKRHHKLGLNKRTLKYAVKIGEIYIMY